MTRNRSAVACSILTLAVILWAPMRVLGADSKSPYTKMAPLDQYLMERNAEIALARSAAPDSISANAGVAVLGREGYETAAEGKNGFMCLVERGWMGPFDQPDFWNPKTRGPICYNAEAVHSILPITYMRTKLILAGLSKQEIYDRVKQAFANKELPALEPGAMCFMMAKQGYLTDQGLTADGAHNMAHLMFYTPARNIEDWGANLTNSPVYLNPQFNGKPEPIEVYMILTGMWSDGTPAPVQ